MGAPRSISEPDASSTLVGKASRRAPVRSGGGRPT